MAGIKRICITDKVNGRGAYRFEKSKRRWASANGIYRRIFPGLDLGDELEECTLEQFKAGYDYALGIDVILTFRAGFVSTLQEKILYTKYQTVTVEYMQDWRRNVQGDWFNLKCQYYFTGYDRDEDYVIEDWVLLDWSAVMRATQQGRISWGERRNKKDGAKASFKYASFDSFPPECVVARQGIAQLRFT